MSSPYFSVFIIPFVTDLMIGIILNAGYFQGIILLKHYSLFFPRFDINFHFHCLLEINSLILTSQEIGLEVNAEKMIYVVISGDHIAGQTTNKDR